MHYKSYPKVPLGESERGSLTVRFPRKVFWLDFGKLDCTYYAYVVDERAEIADHYSLVFAGREEVRIYDDTSLAFRARADSILVYRAGDKGCVIQLIGADPRGRENHE